MYAIRPILVGGKVVAEGEPFDPVSEQHGKELVESGLASTSPIKQAEKPSKAPPKAPAKGKGKSDPK